MTTVREIIKRDIGVKVEGVVKVFDRSALANEVREYVVTDKIEDELKRIVDTFTQVSETLRRGGASRDVVGMWVSGFFGSGKSHFAKVLGYLLQNDELGDGDGERCIDAFVKHLSDSQRGKDVRLSARRDQAEHAGPHHCVRDQEPPVPDEPELRRRDPPLRVLSGHRLRRELRRRAHRASPAPAQTSRQARGDVRVAARRAVAQRARPRRPDDRSSSAVEGAAEDRSEGVPGRGLGEEGARRRLPPREAHGGRHRRRARRVGRRAEADRRQVAAPRVRHRRDGHLHRRLEREDRRAEQPRRDDRQQGQGQGLAHGHQPAGPREGRRPHELPADPRRAPQRPLRAQAAPHLRRDQQGRLGAHPQEASRPRRAGSRRSTRSTKATSPTSPTSRRAAASRASRSARSSTPIRSCLTRFAWRRTSSRRSRASESRAAFAR
jgi:hypothetical protein